MVKFDRPVKSGIGNEEGKADTYIINQRKKKKKLAHHVLYQQLLYKLCLMLIQVKYWHWQMNGHNFRIEVVSLTLLIGSHSLYPSAHTPLSSSSFDTLWILECLMKVRYIFLWLLTFGWQKCFLDCVGEDQIVQNMQSDLCSTLLEEEVFFPQE